MKTICAYCKTIINDDQTDNTVSHGICERCYKKEIEKMKTESKYTPWPWEVDDQGGLYIQGKNGEYIAEVDSEGGRNESFANADLIAAAPELLEALKACLSCLKLDSDMEEDFELEIKQAEKAIARAEGRRS